MSQFVAPNSKTFRGSCARVAQQRLYLAVENSNKGAVLAISLRIIDIFYSYTIGHGYSQQSYRHVLCHRLTNQPQRKELGVPSLNLVGAFILPSPGVNQKRLHQRHHRPARQLVLRHRHPVSYIIRAEYSLWKRTPAPCLTLWRGRSNFPLGTLIICRHVAQIPPTAYTSHRKRPRNPHRRLAERQR